MTQICQLPFLCTESVIVHIPYSFVYWFSEVEDLPGGKSRDALTGTSRGRFVQILPCHLVVRFVAPETA